MRLVGLAALAIVAIWFGFISNHWLDPRPVQRVLFIGNSLTYYNDMPSMVSKMADSAKSPIRYEVTMHAMPGASVRDHWNSPKVRTLLADGNWDRLVLQPEYVWRNPEDRDHLEYAGRIFAAAPTTSSPMLMTGWTFPDSFYDKYSWNRSEHFEVSQGHSRELSTRTGAQLIDVAQVWEDVRSQGLPFSLYKDEVGHPTKQGSYLVALVVFAALSGMDPNAVTYVPWGMDSADAELLRRKAQESLGYGS